MKTYRVIFTPKGETHEEHFPVEAESNGGAWVQAIAWEVFGKGSLIDVQLDKSSRGGTDF